MAESQKNLLRVEIPEDGGDAALRSSSSKGDISTDAKTRSKFSPAVVLNKLNPLEIAKMPGKAVNKLRSRNTVDPRKMAARNAQFNSAMAREGDKSYSKNWRRGGGKKGGGDKGGGEEDRREIDFDPQHGTTTSVQTSNLVITSKYNVLTFLPIFLFEMFSRVAYLYFLLQAALSWWSVVSPFGGVGATAALVFVLVVAAIKAIWEDVKRHREDETMNRSIAHRANPDGSVTDIPWTDVRVGDALLVRDDELFPADLVCLQTELPDRVCFIRTTNLDGETNLKIRKPLDFKGVAADTVAEVMRLHIKLSAEGPNKNLHRFRGLAAVLHDDYATLPVSPGAAKPVWEAPPSAAGAGPFDRAGSGGGAPPLASASPALAPATSTTSSASPQLQIPITMNEMLLRGCMLKNSGAVLGMVVYTGRESRIQMNAARTPNKVGSFDRFLNLQIGLVIAFQLALVVFCASANLVWQHRMGGDRPYLALDAHVEGIYGNGFAQWLINLLTFWILLSYLVPISLFVTLEIVKFWQGFVFINLDPAMKDPVTREHARCRNSGLNEDLGRVEYIFSDKTGTLTSNEMELRAIAIKGVAYGDVDFLLEKHPELGPAEALRRFDPRLDAACAHLHRSKSLRCVVDMGGSSAELLSRGLDDDDDESGRAAAPPSAFASGTGASSPSLSDLGPHLVDFWTNICICQSLILEADPAGPGRPPVYQGPSPDEVALVAAARRLGFEFKARSQSGVTISVLGEDAEFEVLNVLEYSSERGCMSVVARAPDGSIRLYCKGSDAKVMRKIRGDTDPALLRATEGNLHAFARKGLRTLLLGTRILEDDWHAEWDARYQEAAAAFEDRDARLDALGDEVERDLELVGVTAIEDKLQDGVPEAIQTLLEAGIRVWMITGDKMETAVNIAISCHLVGDMDSIMMLVVDEKAFGGGAGAGAGAAAAEQQQPAIRVVSADGAAVPASDASLEPSSLDPIKKPTLSPAAREAERLLDEFLARLIELYRASTGDATVRDAADLPHEWQQAEMAVDGPTLTYILGDEGLARKLALLAAHCSGVVVSRSSPSQKAGVVRLMTRYEMDRVTGTKRGLRRWYARYKRRLSGKMLSIGDGANDVAMLQTADVGVGIMGKEGRQATNNADYAISQFRFLVRLLLVHGNLSYYRLARLIKYSFYKNITFAFVLFYYQFYNGFSGQSLVDSITAAVFNVVFTSVPILLFAVLDRPVRDLETYIHFPKLYDKSDSNTLTTLAFWKTGVLLAVEHGAICFFIPYYAVATSGQNNITDVYSLGKVTFVAMLGTVTLEVALIARYWTWLFAVFVALSYFLVYPYMVVFPLIELAAEIYDPANVGVAEVVLGSPTFWFSIIVCYLLSFGIRYAERTYEWAYRPQDTMIIAEIECENEALGKTWMDRRMDEASRKRLESLGVEMVARPGRGSDSDTSDEERHELRSGTADSAEPGLENVVVHAAPRADALPSPGRA